jgi:hypothetical protein
MRLPSLDKIMGKCSNDEIKKIIDTGKELLKRRGADYE